MSSVKFQGHTGQKSPIVTRIEPFRTIIPIWIHRWLRNDAESGIKMYHISFLRSSVKFQVGRDELKFKVQVQKGFIQEIQKIYKYRMETETLEGLYVPSPIFNSHYTIISSFVTTQVGRWVWEKKKYKIKLQVNQAVPLVIQAWIQWYTLVR